MKCRDAFEVVLREYRESVMAEHSAREARGDLEGLLRNTQRANRELLAEAAALRVRLAQQDGRETRLAQFHARVASVAASLDGVQKRCPGERRLRRALGSMRGALLQALSAAEDDCNGIPF